MSAVDKFQIIGDSLVGRGLSFDIAELRMFLRPSLLDAIADVANAVYRQGSNSARLSYDDRSDLRCAVDALRALAVVVGPSASTGDRYQRAADIIARLLQEQEGGL